MWGRLGGGGLWGKGRGWGRGGEGAEHGKGGSEGVVSLHTLGTEVLAWSGWGAVGVGVQASWPVG